MENFIYLPPELSPLGAVVLIGVSLITSFISAALSLGGGTIMVAVMAVLLPPTALIPVHGIVQLGSNGGRAALLLKHIDIWSLWPFFVGTLIGVAIGGAVFVNIAPWAIEAGIGLFILWTVFGKMPSLGGRYLIGSGIFSAVLTMFFGATGPFISAIVKTMKLDPVAHTGTHAIMMTAQHLLKVVAFGVLGFTFAPYIPLIVAMVICGQIGTVIGKRMLIKSGKTYFKPFLSGLLTILALRLLWTGLEGYLGRSLF
tara:strand:- start:4396 stop:5163 length:768 start_codon:yes stop_codon:yes gene_type:complete